MSSQPCSLYFLTGSGVLEDTQAQVNSYSMPTSLAPIQTALAPTSEGMIARLKTAQEAFLETPQAEIYTQHVLHGGMYAERSPCRPESP
jgi:hypothetical protein